MLRARHLAENGWGDSPTEIRRQLQREGVVPLPSLSTIRCWLYPKEADAHRARAAASDRRRRAARPFASFRIPRTVEAKRARMQALAEAGLSAADVAAVMKLDFGVELGPETVRYSLQHGSVPRALKERTAA
jgi:hypothetical protein